MHLGPIIGTIVLLLVLIWLQKFADSSKLLKITPNLTFPPSSMMVRHPENNSGHPAKFGKKIVQPILFIFTKENGQNWSKIGLTELYKIAILSRGQV